MSQRAGRPAVPLVPARGTLAAVGMEVNVDYLGVRVVDLSGAVLGRAGRVGDFRGSDPVDGACAGWPSCTARSPSPSTATSGWPAAAWPSPGWSTG